MAEPGKYKKDGIVRVALDKEEANQLVWLGFKLSASVGGSKASVSASAGSKPKAAASKRAAKKPSETATETNPDAQSGDAS